MKYYTPKEIAQIVGVTPWTVWKWLRDGRLEGHRVPANGRSWRVSQETLDFFLGKDDENCTKNAV